jgi:putative endonuclease
MSKREKGQRGEALAAAALIKAGYSIVARNWRCNQGEIDLIAEHKGEIVFVEVRARFDGIDVAIESITPTKQRKLQKLAQLYLSEHQLDNKPYRIDVVAVGLQKGQPLIEFIENAVGW